MQSGDISYQKDLQIRKEVWALNCKNKMYPKRNCHHIFHKCCKDLKMHTKRRSKIDKGFKNT